jgi:alanine-synthesizing transaminase
MFAWAPIPEEYRAMGTLAFSKLLLERANVAVSPGVGFGEYGEGFVRIALVENRQRLRQATRNIKAFLAGRNDTADLRRAQRLQAAK